MDRAAGRLWRGVALLVTLLLALPWALLTAPEAKGATVRPITQTLDMQVHGDYILVGNGVLTCDGVEAYCQAFMGGYTTYGGLSMVNDRFTMVNVDVDSNPNTVNSSSAAMTIPAGAKVVSAKLFWSANTGTTAGGGTNTCGSGYGGADVPGGSAQTRTVYASFGGQTTSVTPSTYTVDTGSIAAGQPGYYSALADVTSLFANAPTGSAQNVTVGNIWTPNGYGCYAGWGLEVVYDYGTYIPGNADSQLREVYSFDGHVRLFNGDANATVNLTGLQVLGTGARAGYVAYEGDSGIYGDYLRYSDPTTASTTLLNVFGEDNNQFVGYSPSAVPYRAYNQRYGTFINGSVDANSVSLPNLVSGDSSLTLNFGTTNDSYLLQNVIISVPLAAVAIYKTAANGEVDQAISPGTAPSFRITVYNSGSVAIRDLSVTDAQAPGCARTVAQFATLTQSQYPSGFIPPGGSVQYTCTAPVTSTTYTNTASVNGQTGTGIKVANSNTAKVLIGQWNVSKAPKSPDVPAGTAPTWVITINNTGSADIFGVVVTDAAVPACSANIAVVTAGTSYSYECQGPVTSTTASNSISASGSAKATSTAQISVPLTATSTASVQASQVALAKSVDKPIVGVGEQATFSFRVTNTGSSTLNSFTLTDAQFPACNRTVSTPLAPGASTTVTCTVAPFPAATTTRLTNSATVVATPPSGTQVSATSSVDVNVRALQLTKSATTVDVNRNGVLDAGDTINYSFAVTNTGSTALTSLAVNDPKAGAVTCPVSSLAPGASTTCTAAGYTVTLADVNGGTITNTATASATSSDGVATSGTASVTLRPVQQPNLTLTKTANPTTVSGANQVVTYTFTATNSGNVTVNNVVISDPVAGLSALSCTVDGVAAAQPVSLNPNQVLACTATRTTTQADVDAGTVTNTATVTGTPPTGPAITKTAQATVTATRTPAMTLTKTPSVTTFSRVGQVVTYTLIATNTGNVTLTNVTIDDHMTRLTNRACPQPATLAPGETLRCTGELTVTQADIDGGAIPNTATAAASPAGGGAGLTASADAVIAPATTPAISLSKSPSRTTVTAAGQQITYTISATNTGPTTLSGATITDPMTGLSALSCTPAQPPRWHPGRR